MKKLYSTALVCCLFVIANSQTPGVRWSKNLGGISGDFIFDAKQTGDKGFILVGTDTSSFNSFNENNYFNKEVQGRTRITKVDAQGNVVWAQRQPQNIHSNSQLTSVVENKEGDFVAVGSVDLFAPNQRQLYVTKYSSTGTFIWQKYYGGTRTDKANSIQQTTDSGYIIAGFTNSNDGNVIGNHSVGLADVWLVKLNAAGDIQWRKCFGGTDNDTAYSVVQTPDKGFIVAGATRSFNGNLIEGFGQTDAWIFKTDSLGTLIWQKSLGDSGNEALKSVIVNSDGSYTATGYSASPSIYGNANQGKKDLWVINIKRNGDIGWSKMFGGSEDDQGLSITHTLGNGYLICGYTKSSNGDVLGNNGLTDAWMLRLTPTGALMWQKCIGTGMNEYGTTAIYLSENDFVAAGAAWDDVFYNHDGYLVQLGNTNTIKGILYLDANLNGIKDAGEASFTQQAIVKSEKAGYERSTLTSSGSFTLSVDTGTYSTSVNVSGIYHNIVPPAVGSTFSSYFNVDSISFAVQPLPNKQDLTISVIPVTPARPGFNTTYKLYYKNPGTTNIPSGEVVFKKDSRLSLISSLPSISSSIGDTLKWNYSNLAPADTASITLQLRVAAPPAVSNGDTLNSFAIINPTIGDETPADNRAVIRHRVTGSFDPNDKFENNGGIIRPGHITQGDYLHYTIRFQNTGTDTAFGVTVRDTLDAKLDYSTLEMIASSHSYVLAIEDENRLAWNFLDINLPDSNVNKAASQGYIAYRIKPMSTVALGDTIHNTASIYFDYNLPVKTNNAYATVQNVIILPLKLLHFSGAYTNNTARLKWTTQGEYDFEKFIIERSTDGRSFKEVGVKGSNGSRSSISDYGFADDLTLVRGSTFFYRLRMRDMNGSESYSSIVAIRKGEVTDPVTVFPNPVRYGMATATMNSTREEAATIRLIDLSGKVLWTRGHRLNVGINTIDLGTLQGLPQGIYTVQFVTGTSTVNKEIVVVK